MLNPLRISLLLVCDKIRKYKKRLPVRGLLSKGAKLPLHKPENFEIEGIATILFCFVTLLDIKYLQTLRAVRMGLGSISIVSA